MKISFGRALATLANLAAYGFFGGAVLMVLAGTVGLSLMLLPVLVGLAFVALLALMLRAIWYLESNRVATLFDTDVRDAPMRRSSRRDWLEAPHTLLLQFADPNNWLAVLHGFITTVLGWVTLLMLSVAGFGATMISWPFWRVPSETGSGDLFDGADFFGVPVDSPWHIAFGILAVLFALASCVGLVIAHRALSVPMFAPDRERELRREAIEAGERRGEAIRAAEVERSRIERDLHDGVQPRLVSVGMTLGMARQKVASDPERAVALIDEAHTSTKAAITELRHLARGFHPAILEDRGLDAALSALAAQSHVPVDLDVRAPRRYPPVTEAAMYFAIAESITNANKHARATRIRVTVVERPGAMLWGRIEDDGLGGAERVPGGGIDGVANRVRAASGAFTMTSPLGGPTTVEVSLPCVS